MFVFIKCIFKRCGKRSTKGLVFHLFLKLLLIDHIFSHNVHVSHVYLCSMYLESWNNVVKTIIKLCTKGWRHYHYFMITSKHSYFFLATFYSFIMDLTEEMYIILILETELIFKLIWCWSNIIIMWLITQ